MPESRTHLTREQLQAWIKTHCDNCERPLPRTAGAHSLLCKTCRDIMPRREDALLRH